MDLNENNENCQVISIFKNATFFSVAELLRYFDTNNWIGFNFKYVQNKIK